MCRSSAVRAKDFDVDETSIYSSKAVTSWRDIHVGARIPRIKRAVLCTACQDTGMLNVFACLCESHGGS